MKLVLACANPIRGAVCLLYMGCTCINIGMYAYKGGVVRVALAFEIMWSPKGLLDIPWIGRVHKLGVLPKH